MVRRSLLWLLTAAAWSPVAIAAPAPSIDWPTYGFDTLRTSYNPKETALSPDTVGNLTQLWQFNIAAYDRTLNHNVTRNTAVISGEPLVAAAVPTAGGTTDLVLAGDGNGYFYALDANSTAPGGTVVWHSFLGTRTVGDPIDRTFGVRSTPVLDRSGSGTVYATSNVQVFGLDLATGTILPNWPVTLQQNGADTDGFVHDALNFYDGFLYVGVSAIGGDTPPYFGRVARISVANPKVASNWYVLSGTGDQPTQSGGGVWGWGGVAIDSSKHGEIYLATGNAVGGSMQQTVFCREHRPSEPRHEISPRRRNADLPPVGRHRLRLNPAGGLRQWLSPHDCNRQKQERPDRRRYRQERRQHGYGAIDQMLPAPVTSAPNLTAPQPSTR